MKIAFAGFGEVNTPVEIIERKCKRALEELKNIPTEVKEKDLINRRDLTNEVIFTIDGDDTKDIDDAISIEKLENGNVLLGVHIADVSHYVKEKTNLEKNTRNKI